MVPNEERLKEFWYWIVERQSIYHKRVVLKQRPPWTDDPVLRSYFFTNCYRELDKGTKFWIDEIVPHCLDYKDLVWNLLVYRYFNSIPTFKFLAQEYGNGQVLLHDRKWDHTEVARFLSGAERAGLRVFTSAFTVTGVRFGGYPDKIRNVCFLMEQLQPQVPKVVGKLARAKNLAEVFYVFRGLDGFGAFLAYELAIDINYPQAIVACSEDDFVNPGPGAKAGLTYIYGHITQGQCAKLIEELRWGQDAYLERFGLTTTWYRVWPGYPLSLRSIEHSLCEYSKYARTKLGRSAEGKLTHIGTRRYGGGK